MNVTLRADPARRWGEDVATAGQRFCAIDRKGDWYGLLDEAQHYAPQRPIDPNAARCLGATEDLVKLGCKLGRV